MRQLLFSFIITLLCLSAKAEVKLSIGARTGFNIAHLRKFSPPDMFKKQVILSADIAAVLRLDFNKNFSLQTEIEFTQKGQGWKRTNDVTKYNSKLIANYLEFPVLAVARVGNEKCKAVFYLGPYLAYWAGGHIQNNVTVENQPKQSDKEKYEFTNTNNRIDVGMISGIGADVKLGNGWLQIMARHNLGLISTINKDSVLPKLYNCNMTFSVGYLFSIN